MGRAWWGDAVNDDRDRGKYKMDIEKLRDISAITGILTVGTPLRNCVQPLKS